MSDKVKSQHIERKALLYVRQSSVYQVTHNVESQKLQHAMQKRLDLLGWREIEVIDEDLGCSAAGTVTRSGFERIVRKYGWGKLAPWRRERFPDSPAIVGNGNNWSKCAASSTHY